VSTNFTVCTLAKDKKLQLKCKTQKTQDKIEIMADSGTSKFYTYTKCYDFDTN
jgi:hypothetical protein